MTRLFDEYAYFFIPLLAFMVDAILSKTPAKAKLEASFSPFLDFLEGIFYSRRDRHGQQLRYGLLMTLALSFIIVILGGLMLIFIGWTFSWSLYILEVFYVVLSLGLAKDILALLRVEELVSKGHFELAQTYMGESLGQAQDQQLTDLEINQLAVVSLRDRTSHTLVGPLLAFALLGPIASLVYWGINQLVERFPISQKEYRYFGQFPDRLWFLLSFIPNHMNQGLWTLASLLWRENALREKPDSWAYIIVHVKYACTVAFIMVILAGLISYLMNS